MDVGGGTNAMRVCRSYIPAVTAILAGSNVSGDGNGPGYVAVQHHSCQERIDIVISGDWCVCPCSVIDHNQFVDERLCSEPSFITVAALVSAFVFCASRLLVIPAITGDVKPVLT